MRVCECARARGFASLTCLPRRRGGIRKTPQRCSDRIADVHSDVFCVCVCRGLVFLCVRRTAAARLLFGVSRRECPSVMRHHSATARSHQYKLFRPILLQSHHTQMHMCIDSPGCLALRPCRRFDGGILKTMIAISRHTRARERVHRKIVEHIIKKTVEKPPPPPNPTNAECIHFIGSH